MPDPFDSSDPQRRSRGRISRLFNRVRSRDSRQHLWDFLDLLDERPALKRGLYIGVPVLVLAIAFGFWGYKNWEQRNAYGIARQWLDADRLDRAADAVQNALATEPDRPDSWRLASELAWKKGKRATSVEYAKKAAAVSHYQEDYVLAWAEAAILSDDASQAQEAERYLNPATAQESPRALRLAGEIARRGLRFTDARVAFQSALEADKNAGATYTAIDEIPLGIVSLQTGLAEDRARGVSLLSKWASDPTWGAEALRALLADAVAHHDREAVGRLAEGLRTHPHCTLADVPVCLKALADYDPVRYKAMLDPMEDQSRLNPTHAAELMGWLTQIGQAAEAVRWGDSLYPAAAQKPPIAPAIAEALRATRRWADLRDWVDRVDWGDDLGFLGLAYGMDAARRLADKPKADSLWNSLNSAGHANAAHALFAGDLLYSWGYPKEAAELLWTASDRPDLAFQALGTLARLYQVERDASGQCRVFSRMSAMRPDDRNIANNYAYFAAVTDGGSQMRIERIAESNFTEDPGNIIYRSTYAFVLVWMGEASRALALMEPVSQEWKTSRAVAFAYGSALAGVGRKPEAKEVFDSLDFGNLCPQEQDWIRAALR
jgi:tetratricopeptide (TPR) repeat protein